MTGDCGVFFEIYGFIYTYIQAGLKMEGLPTSTPQLILGFQSPTHKAIILEKPGSTSPLTGGPWGPVADSQSKLPHRVVVGIKRGGREPCKPP